ncbi:MAG: hypothetical protein BWY31_01917 [Lentisphaerae bacterium ADurb.Bin242]|nr:MAG: hypothetical protein BWY31_01917 [Lentisphaerae bacterium ADurb.Bin242]
MKKMLFPAALTLAFWSGISMLPAYDVKTAALTPVEFQSTPEHAPVSLVKNGKPDFVIVTDKQAETRMQGKNRTQKSIAPAVEILLEAFEKCTGTRPEVVDVKEASKYPRMIVVGDCSIARENGVDVSRLPPQGLAVKTFPKGIILAGNDSSLIEGYNSKPLEGRGSSTGTKYAAYDFAERFLGVRYFFPGEYGTLWPEIKELTLTPVSYTDAPYFDTRGGQWYLGHQTTGTPAGKKFWEPYLGKLTAKDDQFFDRWRMGGTIPGGGSHCPRPERIAKAYPDRLKTIFYTSPVGNFWYNPKAHVGNYFDVVNLEFADLLIDSLQKFYASDGKTDEGGYRDQGCNNTYISFGMCDTLMPDTDVVNNPTVKQLGLMTPKDIARGPNSGMANIYARFHQYLAQWIQKEFPGKKLYIMAYYNVQFAGDDPRWKLPPNTEVNLCLGSLPNKTRSKEVMKESVNIAREWYESLGNRPVQKLWLYQGANPFIVAVSGEFVGDIPEIFGKYLGRTSLFFDHCMDSPGNVWFHYPATYAAYRSMWNPKWNVEAGIDEHWEPFYGREAGDFLRRFHKLVKDCYLKYGVNAEKSQPLLYPVTELAKMEELLDKAQKAVKPGTVEEKRMKLFCAPWPKAIQSMKNQISYERPVHSVYQLLGNEKVTLDGKADESFWKKAKPMNLIDPKGSSDKPKYPASLKLAWDKSGIYGLFETSYGPVADKKKDIWANDNYEVLLSPGMKREVKYQFVFDALGNQFLGTQRLLPIPQPFDSYWKAPGFKHVSTSDSQKWTVEFFIPFSVFQDVKVPSPYETWFCNVVRNKADPREYSGTSMTLGNNHNLNMFGIIKFAGKGD